eukprot:3895967-Pleurochrysis_carterae.AAC.2
MSDRLLPARRMYYALPHRAFADSFPCDTPPPPFPRPCAALAAGAVTMGLSEARPFRGERSFARLQRSGLEGESRVHAARTPRARAQALYTRVAFLPVSSELLQSSSRLLLLT